MCLAGVLLSMSLRRSLSNRDSISLSNGDIWGLMLKLVEDNLDLFAIIEEMWRELLSFASIGLGLVLLGAYLPSRMQSRIDCSVRSLLSGFKARATASKSADIR
jgi:hypothetical protein